MRIRLALRAARPASPRGRAGAPAAGVVLFGVLLRPLTEPGFYGGGGLLGTLQRPAPAAP